MKKFEIPNPDNNPEDNDEEPLPPARRREIIRAIGARLRDMSDADFARELEIIGRSRRTSNGDY